MNEQFRVAQFTGAGHSNNASPPRIFKLTKPFADQAVVLNLGYDQKVQVDFSAISNEKITLVHVGEKLIILFDNHSTVTVEPFFDSRHDQLGNLTIEVAPGRDLSVAEFASAFPIINDPSAASAVLPAAGDELGQNNAQASGANFSPFTIDPLPPVPTNTLAPQEELPTFQVDFPTGFVTQPTTPPAPTISLGALPELIVDESFLTAATNGIDSSGTGPAGTTVTSGVLPVTLNVPGGEQSLTFALSISAPGVDSALIDSQTGNHVFLFVENGVVVGREGKDAAAAANGPQDFTVSVDGSGKLTLTDLRSVHEGTGEPGDVSEGTHVPAGLISLTATVTDNSNQSASASVDVGPHLTLQDDGPSIQVVLDGEERTIPNLVVDESNLTAVTNGIDGSIHNGDNSATAWFGGIFQAVTGADGVADPQHPVSYALSIDTTKSTGLVDSQTGENVVLVMNGTTVEGHTASTGLLVFTLSVDSNGFVTFTDDRAVKEPDGTNPDGNEGISIASGAVTLTATITDNDGDTASTGIDLGKQVTFLDDGPVATNVQLTGTVDEDGLPLGIAAGDGGNVSMTIASGNVSTLFLSGADAPLTYSFTASLASLTAENLTSGGVALSYAVTTSAGVETLTATAGATPVFTLTLNETTGAYTFTLLSHVDNAPGLGETAADNLAIAFGSVIQATDSDGDTVGATGGLTISVVDDVPVATNVQLTGTVDEDGLPLGIAAGDGGNVSMTIASGNVSTLFLSGADAPLTYSFTASLASLTAENLTSGGVALSYAVTTSAGVETLTATAGATPVFTLTLNETTGAYTFTLLSHVDNAPGLGETAADNLAIAFGSVIQATDSDGDTVGATGGLTISVVDDVPVATNVQLTGTVDEDGLPLGIAAGDGGNVSMTIASGNVSTLFLSGADAPLTYSFTASLASLTAENLTSGGVALSYAVTTSAGVETLTATAGATPVFTLTLNETTGAYTFTLLSHVDNAPGLGETAADNLAIAFGSVIQATDSDGDTVGATGGLTISVVDDVPVATNVQLTGTVDEDGLPLGIAAGDGGNVSMTIASGNVSTLFLSGADAPLTYSFTASLASLTAENLTSGGVALSYAVTTSAGVETLTATAGATPVFTLTLNETTGAYTFTLLSHVDNAPGLGETAADNLAIAFGSVIQATDSDGDTVGATGGLTISVVDDVPVATNVQLTGTVDEDGLPLGIAAGDGGNVSMTIASGNVSTLFLSGADAPLTYSFTASLASLTAENLTSGGVALSYAVTTSAGVETLTATAGATPVFTLTLNETTGAYTFTLLSHVDNAPGLGETAADNLAIAFGSVIQATDSDGDTVGATGGLTISVVDDVPVATNVQLTGTVDEDGLPLGIAAGDGGNVSMTIASGNVSTLFLSGADAPLTYSFTASLASLTAENLTSGGVALSYAVTTSAGVETLTATAGATPVFTLTLNETTGAYTFTLLSHVDNAPGLGETAADNLAIAFGSVIQATDSDGDTVGATGGLTISVVDDVPVATNVQLTGTVDEDGLPLGIAAGDGGNVSMTIASGNVSTLFLSGADAPLTYSFTASLASLTAENLTSGGVALSYAVTTSAGVETLTATAGATPVFTLTLNETTGAYTFTLLSHVDNAPGLGETAADNLAIAFGSVIQATDSDGDTVGATGGLTISVVDDVPVATNVQLTGTVDEDGLPLGIAAGDGGNVSMTIASGNVSTLFLSGADAPLTYSFTASLASLTAENLTSGGVALSYAVTTSAGVETLTATAGATPVFTLTLNETTGAYTFTLLSHVDNAPGLGETAADNLAIAFGSVIQATDSDGDTVGATGGLTISVVDDVPVATNVQLTGTVDEDGLPLGIAAGDGGNVSMTIASGNVSTLFLSGADAPLTYSFTASLASLTAENLTSGGVALSYAVTTSAGVETLTATAGATPVFTLTLNETTGAYTFTLLSHVDNAPGLGETAADNLAIAFGSVIQATDSDGDTVGATGGLTISVVDDVPVATNVQLTGTVDEDGLPLGIAAGDGGNVSMTIASGNVSTLFLSGADAPLTYSFTASLASLTAENLTSGGVALSYAVTTSAGVETLTATAGATPVFTLTLNETTGAYTFTLLSHVDNAPGLGETAADNLAIAFGSVIQATDSDGDTVGATGGLTISVVDDVPVATNVQLTGTVDEDGLPLGIAAGDGGNVSMTIASGNVSTLFLSGADAPLTYSFTASLASLTAENLTSGGVALSYAVTTSAGVETLTATAGATPVFTLTLNETTGAYTFTLLSHVDNAPGLGETAADNLAIAFGSVIQATDSDGDTVGATGGLTISVVDDVPVATNVQLTGTVDEDGLPLGIAAGDGGNVSMTIASGNVSTLFLSGADAPLTYSFTASLASLTAENLTSGGVALSYAVTTSAGVETLTATAGATPVFTLTLNETTGAYTFTLLSHVDNAPGLGETAADNLAIAFGSVIQATDSDGDTVGATGGLTISVVDDVPVATNVQLTGTVDEDGLPLGIAAGDGGNVSMTIASGNVSTLFLSGADAPLTYSFTASLASLTAENLTSGGVALSYAVTTSAGVETLTATAGATPVFTLTLNETTGAYTFTLLSHVDNAPGLGETAADNLAIAFGSVIQATDSDGDTVGATGGLTISVVDDVPVATNVQLTGTVDEDGLPLGIAAGDGGNVSMTIASGNVSTLFLSGADAPLTYSFTASLASLTAENLTSGGVALSYAVTTSAGVETLTATAGATPVFTLTLNETTGAYTFTLLSHVDNAPGLGETAADNLAIAFGSVIQATDSDGDTVGATGGLTISVVDDVPVATNVQLTGTVDEDGLPLGIAAGDGGNVSMTIASGNVSTLFLSGADAPLTYSFTASLASLTAENLTSGGVALSYAVTTSAGVETLTATAGATPVFTLTLNETTGAYTFTLLSHVDNAPGLGETAADNLAIAFGSVIQATDSDGDTVGATGGLTISVVDDVPVATNVQLTGTVDEDGLPLGIAAGDGGNVSMTIASGNVSTLFLSGADAPLTYSFTASLASLTAENLTSGGVALSYAVTTSAGVETLTATAGATPVFTLTLNETTGAYTFTLLSHVDNAPGLGETAADNLAIAFGSVIQATDSDGDTVGATGGLTISVVDDVPVATNVQLTGTVDEDGLPLGIAAGDGGNVSMTIASGNVSTLFLSGADAPLTYSFTASLASLTAENLTSGGVALSYAVTTSAGVETLTATAGATPVFTLTLNETTGAYTFTLLSHVDNAPGLGETAADNLAIAFGSVIQATDSDGDTVGATGGLTISVVDDVPLINGIQNALLPSIDNTDVQGTWQPAFGADGPNLTAAVNIAMGTAPTGETYTVTDTGTHNAAGEEIFSVKVAMATSSYTFYEYVDYNSSTHTAEMVAYGTQADAQAGLGNNEFFTLSMSADGTYDFHLTSTTALSSIVTTNFTSKGNSGEGTYVELLDGNVTWIKNASSVPTTVPAGQDAIIDGWSTTDATAPDPQNHTVHADNLGFGLDNGNFQTDQLINFEFAQSQNLLDIGIGKGNNASNEHFEIMLFKAGSSTPFAIEDVVLNDGQTIQIDAAHWAQAFGTPGSGDFQTVIGSSGTFGAFDQVEVVNYAGHDGSIGNDTKLNLTTVTFKETTVINDTTLTFAPTITDGDGDTAIASSNLSVSLQGTTNTSGTYTLSASGNEVVLSGPGADTINLSGTNNTIEFNHVTDGGGTGVGTGDTVNGFSATTDSIAVSASSFTGVTFGEVFNTTQVQNSLSNTFTDSSERFLFDTTNHTLYYSSDGTTANEHALAILNLVAAINPTNIHVVH
ncbi:hypothetical protein XH89_25830 [Bradyrhizobium sp. CCBAU 53340]|uniref:T1SS-143 repeat domain-containing protein n=1 Tax=Bradyrhizobium sp. CCBAU 53340 TaxID=1325112 RepID=UPI00188B7808|nr:DUF5801 repeats-in-toxin domain-containing protein [Bradyrhizobium sp. CCBAU 53340]QOZ46508.1 hypothetical protein XH89_25830 [Bradyrhizobium sp. CCBAU 53340]